MAIAAYTFFSSTKAIFIHAHRGNPAQLAENTLPSFMSALEAKADFLEFDTMMTKDGAVIVYDKFTLDYNLCSYKNGYPIPKGIRVKDLTLVEVKNIDCGAYQSIDFPTQEQMQNLEIITLEELFQAITTSPHPSAKKIKFNIKFTPCTLMPEKALSPGELCDAAYANLDYDERIVLTIIGLVEKFKLTQRVIYQSFDIETLRHIKTLVPTATISLLKRQTLFELIEKAKDLKATIISPHQELLDEGSVDLFHKNGLLVIPWVVNDKASWVRLITFGVDGIITDYPKELAAFIDANKDQCTIS